MIFLLSFLILTRFNIDPDLGWHLAIGNHFWQTGEILRGDIFSWTMPGFAWGNSYFFYQILVAFLFRNLGYVAAAFLFGAVVACAILILLPKKLNLWSMLVVFLGCALALANVGIRPHNLDWPFLSLLLVLLEAKAFKKIVFAGFWFVFFALWANIHVGFVFGLAIFVGMVIVDFVLSMHKEKWSQFWRYILMILAAFAGTFLTPFHYQMWKSIFFDSAGLVGWVHIAALQSTAITFPFNIFLALSCLVLVVMLLSKKNIIEFSWLLMASFVFLLAFFVVDFVYIWVIVFMFLGVRFFAKREEFLPRLDLGDKWVKFSLFLPVFLAVLALVLNFFLNWIESRNLELRFAKDAYPVGAVSFLTQNGLGENLFNEYAWGGYIDWYAPNLKVFIDGRMTGWRRWGGNYILSDYLAILKGDCELSEGYQIKTVLVKSTNTPVCFSDFVQVYKDEIAQVLIKE